MGIYLDDALDGSFESSRVGSYNLLDLLAILEDEECGHSADTQLGGNICDFIDIDLDEMGIGELLGEPVGFC